MNDRDDVIAISCECCTYKALKMKAKFSVNKPFVIASLNKFPSVR